MNQISAEKNAEYVGNVYKVLVDGYSKTDANVLSGRTDGFKLVNFRACADSSDLIGKLVDVKITNAKTFSLEGEMLLG